MKRVLYLSYDGLTDPLGRSQVLPYLVGLSRLGHRIAIISCEKPQAFQTGSDAVEQICTEAGIEWHPIAYHKSPPVLSTVYDVRAMHRLAKRLHRQQRFELVHCRSYIPTLVGLALKRGRGVPFVFDMRGFWPEEKAESGSWQLSNPLYRRVFDFFKKREKDFLREAAHIVSLTEAAADEIKHRRDHRERMVPITIIPCCVDFGHFTLPTPQMKAAARQELGIDPDAAVMAYVGSLGGNYMLDELLDAFRSFDSVEPKACFLFITRETPETILAAAAAKNVPQSKIVIRSATREQMPLFVSAADVGIAFKKSSFSGLACSPTKLGEMLAMGVPVIANAGVGDVLSVIEETGAGAAIATFDDDSYAKAIEQVHSLEIAPEQIRRRARQTFDVELGIARYDAIYRAAANSC